MEAEQKRPAWLNPDHPNYDRWAKGRDLSIKRAEAVRKIILSARECKNLDILDLGSGEGGTSVVLAEQNNVISYDLGLLRLQRQKSLCPDYSLVNGNSGYLPFRNRSFDIVILQDVIEHIRERELLVNEVTRVLRYNGVIYVSTPNKHSVVNILADPHWGMPILSILKRSAIKKYFLRRFRKEDMRRSDIAELLSLDELKKLFTGYRLSLYTKEIVELLSKDPAGILWSSLHTAFYNLLKKSGLFFILKKIAHNDQGFLNNFFTPTFYIIFKK